MSEEILKALMQLFAIITKQDGGVEENEEKFVWNFLKSQLGESGTDEYFNLFREAAGLNESKNGNRIKLTSVLDSVRILGLCKKINKTLNQTQKVVVILRLFELVASDHKLTEQRLAIIQTVGEVFRIPGKVYSSIEAYVLSLPTDSEVEKNILLISSKEATSSEHRIIHRNREGDLSFLRIKESDLYFLRYSGNDDLYLNGLGIHKNRIYLFAKGSTIRLPKGKPLYYSDIASFFLSGLVEHKILFEVRDLDFNFRNGSQGLKDISFTADHGNMIAIMGSSGTGKTTLLNVLSGIEKPSSGTVKVNSTDLHKQPEELKGAVGYVPQDDLLIEELTVYENLYYNAKLCFRELSATEIRLKVEETLENLGLSGQKDLKVGSPFHKTISGGQRKRLNIALELIREPSILFVDEPTSGLSSRDSENVMDLLRELTLRGKLIFVVIHQPSSEIFKMFDRVIVLDEGGYLVYYGNPVEAVMYFKLLDDQINSHVGECPACGNVNPELIFNILESRVVDEYGNYTRKRKTSPSQWKEYFQSGNAESRKNGTPDPPPRNLNIPSWFRQIAIFTQRDFLSKLGNVQYVILTLLEAPVLGFILAYIIRYIADPSSDTYIFRENENIPIYIFMAMIVAVFLGLTVSAEEIFRDRKILRREHFLSLSRSGYLVSKLIILFGISALQAILFVIIANSVIELKDMYFYYAFAFFTTAAFANLLGLNISSAFNSAVTIYIAIPLLIIPMMVLSGAMFSFDKLNRNISRLDKVPLLAELMPTRWSYEALMVNQFKNNRFQSNFFELDKYITNADFKQSYYLPELESRLKDVRNELREKGRVDETAGKLRVLENEINKETEEVPVLQKKETEFFSPQSFDISRADTLENMINRLKEYYLGVFTRESKLKNNRIRNLLKNRRDIYYRYLNDYHNESLADHVRKIYERKKIVEYGNRLVRMTDPVYQDPDPENRWSFRTHFFAPTKYFFGKFFDTYAFNIAVIWILSAVLYSILYFELIKKIMGLGFKRKSKSGAED